MSSSALARLTDPQSLVLFDGAMGTMLYAKGVFINQCYDELNVRAPDLVLKQHDDRDTGKRYRITEHELECCELLRQCYVVNDREDDQADNRRDRAGAPEQPQDDVHDHKDEHNVENIAQRIHRHEFSELHC